MGLYIPCIMTAMQAGFTWRGSKLRNYHLKNLSLFASYTPVDLVNTSALVVSILSAQNVHLLGRSFRADRLDSRTLI